MQQERSDPCHRLGAPTKAQGANQTPVDLDQRSGVCDEKIGQFAHPTRQKPALGRIGEAHDLRTVIHRRQPCDNWTRPQLATKEGHREYCTRTERAPYRACAAHITQGCFLVFCNTEARSSMLLDARSITKSFGDTTVLRGVTFGAAESEIVALLGPSGCGKSTLLRIIAGLEQEYTGTVIFDGRALDAIPVHRRGFGLMFQDFALFPHRTVGQNVAFGPRMQGLDRREIDRRVDETLELVGLRAYRNRTIFELSGGERQRVALARSLAPQPRLLMLDEPLGALDRTLRERLTGELRAIIKAVGLTSVYVTHDQVEAFAVADRIVLMDRGQIVQSGSPIEVYCHPANRFAAQFLGLNNLLP